MELRIKSTFALLDVLGWGRVCRLSEKIKNEGPVPVTITGFITGELGHFDGTSTEFTVDVRKVEIEEIWMELRIKSTFALLDVLGWGRVCRLSKKIKNEGPVPVTITGFITGEWGHFDGTSAEFTVDVRKVEIGESE